MSKAAVVFIFEEPEDPMLFGTIVAKAKEVFEFTPEVKVHVAVKDAANTIVSFLDTSISNDSNLVAHARRELELLGEEPEFIEGYLKVIQAFANMGHSGGSASVAIPVIHELLSFNNLSPLTTDPQDWQHHPDNSFGNVEGIWQNRRNGKAFSTDAGKTFYLIDEERNENNEKLIHISVTYIKGV